MDEEQGKLTYSLDEHREWNYDKIYEALGELDAALSAPYTRNTALLLVFREKAAAVREAVNAHSASSYAEANWDDVPF